MTAAGTDDPCRHCPPLSPRTGTPRWNVTGSAGRPFPALAININQPASFVHWSIFDVTVANLVLIAVMVGIFAAALLIPFPRGSRHQPAAAPGMATDDDAHDATAGTDDRADDG